MKDISVYRYPFDYAVELGEETKYRESMAANRKCAKAIEDAIRENTRPAEKYGTYFDAEASVKQVVDAFGLDRTVHVIANTVQAKDWDARFSVGIKQWARTIPVFKDVGRDGTNNNVRFAVHQSHPVYVDAFAWELRKLHDLPKNKQQAQRQPNKKERKHPQILMQICGASFCPKLGGKTKCYQKNRSVTFWKLSRVTKSTKKSTPASKM